MARTASAAAIAVGLLVLATVVISAQGKAAEISADAETALSSLYAKVDGAKGLGPKAVAGCHLSEETELKEEAATRHAGAPCLRRTWTATLASEGGSLRAGGATLTLREGEAGTGRGEAIHAPGHPVSLKETIEYEMPTPARTARFKRSLEVTLRTR